MEKLASDKHSSVLQKIVNYERKKFYITGYRSVEKVPGPLVNLPLGQTARKLFWNENKRF
jgi:hypothetical protein